MDTVKTLGIPPEALGYSLSDSTTQAMLAPLVKKVAFVEAINDAWALVALITCAALLVVPLAKRSSQNVRPVDNRHQSL